MELALPLDSFVNSDIALSAQFASSPITLDDTLALLRLLNSIMEATQTEIADRLGHELEILPVVSVSNGSIRLRIDAKPSQWSVTVRTTAREVFLAVALFLNPGSVADAPEPTPPPLSESCQETIRTAYEQAQESWQYFGKGFTATFEASCGSTTVRTKIEVPPATRR